MKKFNSLPDSHLDRMTEIIDFSWRSLKSQFLDKRLEFSIEASFQHYFAQVISNTGELFCSKRNDVFHVDLETRSKALGRPTRIDITCSFGRTQVKCAIELKFKTAKQGAQDLGRIGAFEDIQKLEEYVSRDYDLGRFYFITDSSAYVKKSKRGNGTIFTMHDGAVTKSNSVFPYMAQGKVIDGVKQYIEREIQLNDSYVFSWENKNNWYFLEVLVSP